MIGSDVLSATLRSAGSPEGHAGDLKVLETQVEAAAVMLTNRDATQNARIVIKRGRERETGRRTKGKNTERETVKMR